MSHTTNAVTIKQLPERVTTENARLFLRDLESSINVMHPCIVLDCSRLDQMDTLAVHLLLDCLEHVMKHNGDIKLAAVPAEAKAMLELTGVSRLFEQFDTGAEAVCSFQPPPLHVAPHHAARPGSSQQTTENAA